MLPIFSSTQPWVPTHHYTPVWWGNCDFSYWKILLIPSHLWIRKVNPCHQEMKGVLLKMKSFWWNLSFQNLCFIEYTTLSQHEWSWSLKHIPNFWCVGTTILCNSLILKISRFNNKNKIFEIWQAWVQISDVPLLCDLSLSSLESITSLDCSKNLS